MALGLGLMIVVGRQWGAVGGIIWFGLFAGGLEIFVNAKLKELHKKILIQVAGMIDKEQQF